MKEEMIQDPMKKKKEITLLLAPILLFGSTLIIFQVFAFIFGAKLGHFLGFVFYWVIWCILFSILIVGVKGIPSLFKGEESPFTKKNIAFFILAYSPAVTTLITTFIPEIATTSFLAIISSLGLAIGMGILEEVLWRGLYIKMFPDNLVKGIIYPSIGFTIWHLSPLLVIPTTSPGGNLALLPGVFFIGICFALVTWRTKSITWAVIAHFLLNFFALGAVGLYF
ncbi:MAG: type II CAAX prenyl endopeptidase Rce1 family protein [bacterium]